MRLLRDVLLDVLWDMSQLWNVLWDVGLCCLVVLCPTGLGLGALIWVKQSGWRDLGLRGLGSPFKIVDVVLWVPQSDCESQHFKCVGVSHTATLALVAGYG